jgi:AraC family transcriptional regulator, arabinose operon regulatory protein
MTHIREGFPGQRLFVLPPAVQERSRELAVVRDLYITDLGHYPVAPHHYVERPQGRPEVILIYCTNGSGWCRIRERKWRVGQGSAIFIPAHAPHLYGAAEEAPWAIYWVHFCGESCTDYLDALRISDLNPLAHVPPTALVDQAFEEILSYVPHGYSDASLLGMSTALARLLGLLNWRQRSRDARSRPGEDKILQSIQYMREHLDSPCDLSSLAGRACLSVSHYSFLFRKFTNTSPIVFCTRLKMQEACYQLAAGPKNVAEIGFELGYEDPLYFSRIFKKIVGVSPTCYRALAAVAQA